MIRTPFEDWETDNRPSIKLLSIIAVVILVVAAGSAVAIYKIVSDPSPEVVVTVPAELSAPSVNATAAVIGDTIQLTTTLSDSAEGLQVFFLENMVQIGSAYTNSLGQAIFNRVMNTAGNYTFTAECTHP